MVNLIIYFLLIIVINLTKYDNILICVYYNIFNDIYQDSGCSGSRLQCLCVIHLANNLNVFLCLRYVLYAKPTYMLYAYAILYAYTICSLLLLLNAPSF